jgi:hypothetical protein
MNTKSAHSQFYRFQVFQGKQNADGKIEKSKTVGMAYLKEGQGTYTLRLWTFLTDRFYLLPNKNDSSRYFVMTREQNRNPSAKTKYFWNIVGNAHADSTKGCVQINFDLLDRPVFMSMFPESSAKSAVMLDPEELEVAA